jgi:hypothetical protein
MLKTDGIPPKLKGHECEALLCQQYWRDGKLEQPLDILFIKSHDRWTQLYFENETVYWRLQPESPEPHIEKEGDPFRYPLVDLGIQYGLNGQLIEDYNVEPVVGGAKVRFEFEKGNLLVCSCVEGRTRIQHIKR